MTKRRKTKPASALNKKKKKTLNKRTTNVKQKIMPQRLNDKQREYQAFDERMQGAKKPSRPIVVKPPTFQLSEPQPTPMSTVQQLLDDFMSPLMEEETRVAVPHKTYSATPKAFIDNMYSILPCGDESDEELNAKSSSTSDFCLKPPTFFLKRQAS